MQFTEPSEDPDDDLALYDAIAETGNVILATGEPDEQGRSNVLGGDENLKEAGAQAAASTLPTDPGGSIRRYDLEDTHLITIPALVASRYASQARAGRADRLPRPGGHHPDVLVRGRPRRQRRCQGAQGQDRGRRRDGAGPSGRPPDVRSRHQADARRGDPGQRDLDRVARQPARADRGLGRVRDRRPPGCSCAARRASRSGRCEVPPPRWPSARCTRQSPSSRSTTVSC